MRLNAVVKDAWLPYPHAMAMCWMGISVSESIPFDLEMRPFFKNRPGETPISFLNFRVKCCLLKHATTAIWRTVSTTPKSRDATSIARLMRFKVDAPVFPRSGRSQ